MITRRALGGLAAATIAARSMRAEAANETFVSGWGLPANLDPHQIFDVPMQTVMFNAYDSLYRYENDPPEVVPWLATSHTVSDDGLIWDFKLRPGVKFHDGSELTAEDVVYSFHRVLTLRLAPAGAFLPVLKPENVSATDNSQSASFSPGHMPHSSPPSRSFPSSTNGSSARTRRTATGARPGSPPTVPVQAPTRSSPRATVRSNNSTWKSSTPTSWAGRTTRTRCAGSPCARPPRPRPESSRCSTALWTGPTPTSPPTR